MTPAFIQTHVDLQPLHTLALPARAHYFAAIDTSEKLTEAVRWAQTKKLPLLVLGGGSNSILRGEWAGLVLHIALLGKTIQRSDDHALVTIAAGESWPALVQWSLHEQLFGLENLTLIPGTAGAAPIQNIGAYGVELSSVLHSVRGYALDTHTNAELSVEQCQLGYRDSIFKQALRDRFIITAIVLKLHTQFTPIITYPALRQKLDDDLPGQTVTAAAVESAVRAIRQSKLPDPVQLPNVGSFFKNPVISVDQFAQIAARFAPGAVPHFSADNRIKIPAAWLVDQAGWKGRRVGAVGVHAEQALVLIHYGGGTADELLALAAAIQLDVQRQFDIVLEREPILYGV